jgi:hypothetical protein
MRFAALIRERHSDHGTFGRLFLDDGLVLRTAELPWRDNEPNVSCIPDGMYGCAFIPRSASGKYVSVYHVRDVPDRGGILIHAGNFAGDKAKGLRTDSYGCILLGTEFGVLGTQHAVLASRMALQKFVRRLNEEPLKLMVTTGH